MNNGRKFLKCVACDREERVAIESQAVLCAYCTAKGVHFPTKKERKEMKKQEKMQQTGVAAGKDADAKPAKKRRKSRKKKTDEMQQSS